MLLQVYTKLQQRKSNIVPIINEKGQSIHDHNEIAETLKLQYECFLSTCIPDHGIKMPNFSFTIWMKHKPQLNYSICT